MSTNLRAQTVATPRVLHSSQLGATADTTVATVPADSTWSIKTAVAVNVSAATTTININVVPSGGSHALSRRAVYNWSIVPGDSLDLSDIFEGMQLREGDFIGAWAGAASAINLLITGVEAS